ncbi:MAG TPA: hypothetical protein VGL42_16850 [Opitutaceae bacterium]
MGDRPPDQRARSFFWLAFALPLILGLSTHGSYYFAKPSAETGDFAANALQIWDAKHLCCLTGNYSRFRFHHPGPAFFYVYAAGEYLFYNLLHLVPAPGAAHSLAGLLLQCYFFAAGISILVRFVSDPWARFTAIAVGCLHFFASGFAFVSIWPPHQLLMPFFCALMSAPAVICGEIVYLPLLVLSACFCIHGHVAQPLFMLPLLAAGSAALIWRALKPVPGGGERRKALVKLFCEREARIAVLIAGLFLVPLIIEAFKGKSGNWAAIFSHLHRQSGETNTLSEAVVYYLGALRYDFVGFPTGTIGAALQAHLAAYLAWLGAVGLSVWWALSPRDSATPLRRGYLTWLLIVGGAAALLAIVWALRMDGGMYAFNSDFVFAITAVPLLVAAVAIISVLGSRRGLWWCCLPALVCLNWKAAREEVMQQDSNIDFHQVDQKLDRLVGAEAPGGARAGFQLRFAPEQWSYAALVANQLEEMGVPWEVPTDWRFLFGNGTKSKTQSMTASLIIAKDDSNGKEGTPLADDIVVRRGPAIIEAIVAPTRVPAAYDIHSALYTSASGLSTPDDASLYSWSVGTDTVLRFKTRPASSAVRIEMDLQPFLPARAQGQRFEVSFCGQLVGKFEITAPLQRVTLEIPREQWNQSVRNGGASLEFHWTDAASPQELGISADARQLAVGFRTTSFSTVP